MRYFTFRKDALARMVKGQVLRFTRGKGYWLFGKPAVPSLMFDSVNPSEIPKDAKAVAGYVNGMWPTFKTLPLLFPNAHLVSIAVTSRFDADCLDVETGDATNDVAAAWVKRQRGRGVFRPIVYTSVSNAGALLRDLARGGVARSDVRLWTAHYTLEPHLCSGRCGFGDVRADATQFHDKYQGRNLDASLCAPSFFQ